MIVEHWQDGVLVDTYDDGQPAPLYAPLDAAGALATLLVVEGVLPLTDAANAVTGGDEAHLVAEAEAWSLAP